MKSSSQDFYTQMQLLKGHILELPFRSTHKKHLISHINQALESYDRKDWDQTWNNLSRAAEWLQNRGALNWYYKPQYDALAMRFQRFSNTMRTNDPSLYYPKSGIKDPKLSLPEHLMNHARFGFFSGKQRGEENPAPVPASPGSLESLIQNGDFNDVSDGLTGWSPVINSAPLSQHEAGNDAWVYTSGTVAVLGRPEPTRPAVISQILAIKGGVSYRLAFAAKNNTSDPPTVTVRFFAGNTILDAFVWRLDMLDGILHSYDFQMIAPSTADNVSITFMKKQAGEVFIDQVSFTKTP